MQALFGGILAFEWQQAVMILIGLVLIWLAIAKKYEPTLLLPIGLGPFSRTYPSPRPWESTVRCRSCSMPASPPSFFRC
jgi:Na+-transporting methylmalonyl-CoA/oxaloacetate decarboxylase beta subunit